MTELREPCGVLLINKPEGWTSFDVTAKVRRLFQTKKVGHTGTLDPMATGLLVVLVGRAAKAAEFILVHDKSYKAILKLGITTDTEDVTGKVLTESAYPTDINAVKTAADGFIGSIMQIPPMYSALKIDGKKLCDLARKGQTVEREPRPITVHSISVSSVDGTDDSYYMDVSCSSGTYIRTLCADIGASLGCGGVMAALSRTSVGDFKLEASHTVDELETLDMQERERLLLPTETLFFDLKSVVLSAFFERLFRSGCEIYQKKLGTDFCEGERLRICAPDGHFFAIGEVKSYPNGSAIKMVKLFEI